MLFTALSAFGATLGRKVWNDTRDPHRLWPMLNLVLVSGSGKGKSSAIDRFQNLIEGFPSGKRVPISEQATPERFHDVLMFKSQTILKASEMARAFPKTDYMKGMIPYVTELLDYKESISRSTRKDEELVVLRPSVTIIAGTTVNWLQTALPDEALTGGFLARFLIVHEKWKDRKVAFPGEADKEKRETQRTRRELLAKEFAQLVRDAPGGEIDWANWSAKDIYSTWYHKHEAETGYLEPIAARAAEFVLRLAILIVVSCGRTTITVGDINCAIGLYAYATKQLMEVLVPFTSDGKYQGMVLDVLGDKPMAQEEIYRAMQNTLISQKTQTIIQSLVLSGKLKRLEGNRFVRARE